MKAYRIIFLAVILAMSACSSRKPVVYVPVAQTSIRTDTVRLCSMRSDSLILRDSIRIFHKGDSICVEEIKWRIRVKEKIDTVFSVRVLRDTITKIIETPADASGWNSKLNSGGKTSGLGAKIFKSMVAPFLPVLKWGLGIGIPIVLLYILYKRKHPL